MRDAQSKPNPKRGSRRLCLCQNIFNFVDIFDFL